MVDELELTPTFDKEPEKRLSLPRQSFFVGGQRSAADGNHFLQIDFETEYTVFSVQEYMAGSRACAPYGPILVTLLHNHTAMKVSPGTC